MILPVEVHGLNVWQHWKMKLTYVTFAMCGLGFPLLLIMYINLLINIIQTSIFALYLKFIPISSIIFKETVFNFFNKVIGHSDSL
jgi:hypothetical protein